jgi:hypothetical protein
VAIDQHGRLLESHRPADMSLSPELALVDPELAQRARAALGAPGELPAAAGHAGTPAGSFRLVSAPNSPRAALPAASTFASAQAPLRHPVAKELPELAPASTRPLPELAPPRRARRVPRPVLSTAVVLGLLAAVTALSSVAVSRPELLAPEPQTRPPAQAKPQTRPPTTAQPRTGPSTTARAQARPPTKAQTQTRPSTRAVAPSGARRAVPRVASPAKRVPVPPAAWQRGEPRRLTWAPVAGVESYDVELYRRGRLVFHGTTKTNAIEVPDAWRFQGQRQRLVPGVYEWFVWAYGDARTRRPLVVHATLTILRD